VDGDLVIPVEELPENLKDSMGAEWRLREQNRKAQTGTSGGSR
jgi:ribonuclease Z